MLTVDNLNFRDMYHEICFLSVNGNISKTMKSSDLPRPKEANGVLVYGYIDHEAGFTFEVLGWGFYDHGKISPFAGNKEVSSKLRRSSVADCIIVFANHVDLSSYQDKIDMVKETYSSTDSVEITRGIESIDNSRNTDYPDDVLVYLLAENKDPEGCWVRCLGVDENEIKGRLLNEPSQNFGVHSGDVIGFGVMSQEDGDICVAMV